CNTLRLHLRRLAATRGPDFASLVAMTQSGAPLPSGRGSVGATTKPAADHALFLTWLASLVWLSPYGHRVLVIVDVDGFMS
ncbi:MAG TPA: hypothetical protein VGQ81_01745, partial [Acidobacteriota bacterium]|nr:hypothetical protein [Acidobacteriota bacterium]